MKKTILVLFLLLPLITFSAKGRDSTEIRNSYSMSDNREFKSMIVASVGNMKITAQEFLTSYEYGPAFVKREKDSPRRYLDFMIYEKLLAQEGYSKGIDKSKELNRILSDIEADLATEQLYRKKIWDKVQISQKEIDRGVSKEQVTLILKWIYKPELSGIEKEFRMIKSGIPFDSLFVKQFSDSVRYEDRYLETTRFQLERNNKLLASITDTLEAGEISLPIKTTDGCYIVKLENQIKMMITTESELDKLRYDVERVLFKGRADSLSDHYVNELMLSAGPVIIRKTFNILKAYIGRKILQDKEFAEWNMLKNIHTDYPDFNPANLQPYLYSQLVQLKKGSISLQDFMRWYSTREPYIRLNPKSHQAFYLSLQQIVWRMVRDKLLGDIAYAQEYNQQNEVKVQKKWWKDKLVYAQMKLEISGSIKLTDEKIREYYEQNKRKYTTEKGEMKPFEEVNNDVRNDLVSFEYTKRIVNKILGLKDRVSIKIHEDVLNKLPIDIQNNPKAIDVYTVKNGGIFLRQAYPTIDYEWQFWN